jgi:uncharacterized protein (TIGR00255 family)
MIKSMTGFGKAECVFQKRRIIVEIKSLNSKFLDVNARIPNGFRTKELEIRNMLSEQLRRGKVDFTLSVEEMGDASNYSINKELAKKYFAELKGLSDEMDQKEFSDYLPVIMRLPDVLVSEKEDVSEEEWELLKKAIAEALRKIEEFRKQEGKSLVNDLLKYNENIQKLLTQVEPFEEQRLINLQAKIKKDIYDIVEKDDVDQNRFEQELVYYLDKLDITEEKVRLSKHCSFFIETLNEKESQGKKLGFISQEMGREINTLGSKANEANIQKIVVQMKDELEKIKEQLFNIL